MCFLYGIDRRRCYKKLARQSEEKGVGTIFLPFNFLHKADVRKGKSNRHRTITTIAILEYI